MNRRRVSIGVETLEGRKSATYIPVNPVSPPPIVVEEVDIMAAIEEAMRLQMIQALRESYHAEMTPIEVPEMPPPPAPTGPIDPSLWERLADYFSSPYAPAR